MKSKIIKKVRVREGLACHRRRQAAQEQIEQVKASVIETARRERNNTGRCTVRELVLGMVTGHMGDTCEMAFPLPEGRRVNVEVRITRLEGDEAELP